MPAGALRNSIVRTTSFVAGSMRETVPSPEFATQTAPAPTAMAVGSSPTRMVLPAEPVLGSMRVSGSVLAGAIPAAVVVGGDAVWVANSGDATVQRFDPVTFYAFCDEQVQHGGMDRKWFPDFVRIVDEFEYTQTQKILVRNLKRVHFDRRRLPDARLYWRQRGGSAFRELTREAYESLRGEFERREKLALLDR